MNSKSTSNNDNQSDNISNNKIKKSKENNINDIKSLAESNTTSYLSNFLNNTNKTSNKQNVENAKNTKYKYLLTFERRVQNNLKDKYNYSNRKYELLCINHLLRNSNCRLVSIFKERMIIDYIDEFLKRIYNLKESKERIPKFYLYYKHYSIFFGQPFFTDFDLNLILQKNGEKKARIYYKNQYQNGESKDDDNENGFAESGSDDEDERGKNEENKKKKNNNNNIFNSDIKETIDNVTLMTTINSIENNTINLGLNNEKIEIFSENKKERSNDTTIGEIVEDINKGIEKVNIAKSKNNVKKKKKKSSGENNIMNEDIKKNKKKLMDIINNNNNNNIKKNIKNNSIKKKLFYIRHQNVNLNMNSGGNLISNTQRYSQKKTTTSIKNDNLSKNNNFSSNNNISSNKAYKKRRLLSYGNEDINKIINPNSHKSPKHLNNINFNYLNTITTNTIYRSKKLNQIKKINNPFSMNKKSLNMNNNTNAISSLCTNRNINKIKICKTLKNFGDKNKIKKNDIRNLINKDLKTISGDKKKKLNKISYKKFGFSNLTETQIMTEKNNNEKIKGRNIISPLNDKYYENYTLNNNYININNLPFSANKNKNCINNGKNINNNILLNNLSYENINYDKGIYHKRTKSNLLQNNFKKNINDNPTFSKVNIRNTYNAYVKPSLRINKNDKLFINKPIESVDMNYFKNQTSINNYYYNEPQKNKKLSTNNDYYLSNLTKNNQNLINDSKNNAMQMQNIDNPKNSNFNKYVLDAIKKSRHQHCYSLTNQINPFHTLNANDDIFKNKDTLKNLNKKGQKVRDVLQIALSLFVNENSSRNYQNNLNVMEKYPTYYKLNKNPTQKNDKNNPKRNYNLNININNEININENNIINNSTYLINDLNKLNNKNIKRKTMDKNISKNFVVGNDSKQREKEKDKNIINLKQKKYNIDQPISSSSNNICKLTKNSINENRIISLNNNKKAKKMKSRNYEGGNLNNVLTSINNNYMNTVIFNNNTFDNDKSSYKNKVNSTFNKNKNIIKSYYAKNGKNLFLFNGQ